MRVPQANAYLHDVSFQAVAIKGRNARNQHKVPTSYNDSTLNENDVCLLRDNVMWDTLVGQGGLRKLCKGHTDYFQPPWVAMPKEGRRFKPISTLLVSTVATPYTGNNIAVMQERVSLGYDGVISDVVCEILPGADGVTGFVQGSGDLTWRLDADGRYLRDLGNITVALGSLTNPSPVPRGMLRVYSHDLLTFSVAFAPGADARISPTARIVCSITGWIYPR